MFNILELAETVQRQAQKLGFRVTISHLPNPRVAAEEHYYNPRHQKLVDLGLQPHLLSDVLVDSMLVAVRDFAHRIRREVILPHIQWNGNMAAAVKTFAPVS